MKSYSKNSCIVIIIALILAFVAFLTLTNLGELFYEEFFPIIVIAVGLIGLISIFIGFAILGQNGIYDAYNDCSQLATIGAALLTIICFCPPNLGIFSYHCEWSIRYYLLYSSCRSYF